MHSQPEPHRIAQFLIFLKETGIGMRAMGKVNIMNAPKICIHPAAVWRTGFYLLLLAGLLAMTVTQAAGVAATNTPSAIPWNEIGAKAGADYQGDGLAVTPTESGARLHCVFQRLDGEATPEGLWLTSTVTNTVSDRFRVTAMEVGRTAADADLQLSISRIQHPVGGCGRSIRLRPDGAFQPPRADGRILREHGRRAAGFHRGASACSVRRQVSWW